ncbi:hypothetical protein ACFCYX_32200 [Streptomyces populi]|nr:hypothetical protein [Streptomyces populi]
MTTATLLVAAAATTLSGCVTVQRPPASGTPASPSGLTAPRPDGKGGPGPTQVPAREALGRVGPSREPSPDATARDRTTPPPRTVAPSAPPRHAHPAPRPEPRHEERRVAVPPGVPGIPKDLDVCALGRQYGGWKANSREAIRCAKAYGN